MRVPGRKEGRWREFRMKAEGHLGRCYLKGRAGDAANVILSAVGYNLRLVLAWLRIILRVILLARLQTFIIRPALKRLLNKRLHMVGHPVRHGLPAGNVRSAGNPERPPRFRLSRDRARPRCLGRTKWLRPYTG